MRGSFLNRLAACALCAVAGGLSAAVLMHAVERSATMQAGKADSRVGVGNDRAGAASDRARFPDDRAAITDVGVGTADPVEPGTPATAADAIVRLAAAEPRVAMDRALALDRHWLRLDTAERVASAWAERSPSAAIAFVQATSELDPEVKSRIRTRVLDAWAGVDSVGALGYLMSPEGQNLFFFDRATGQRLAREISTQKPYELLAAADTLPRGVVRAELRDAAIPSLVADDLAGAVREAALATPGSDQRQWVGSIVPAFVRADPEGALEWARDIDTRVPGTLRSVTVLVQETGADRIGPLNN